MGRGPLRPSPTAHARDRQLVRLGGEGTPRVQDFCLGEIALARGTGVTATMNATADVLDLVHRLPRTWAVCAGRRGGALGRAPGGEAVPPPAGRPGRGGGPCGGADHRRARPGVGCSRWPRPRSSRPTPVCTQERVEAERRRRYVSSSRTDEFGLRTRDRPGRGRRRGLGRGHRGPGRRDPGTAAPRRQPPTSSASIAFGWLARPAELLTLLLEHRDPQDTELDLDEAPNSSRATAFPADLLDALRGVDLSPLAPRAVLYVHLHEAASTVPRRRRGVARVEGLGPVTLTGLHELLGRTDADREAGARPVRPGPHAPPMSTPSPLKERVHLTTGGDYWPYATSTSRRVDYDHPIPYPTTRRTTGPDRHPQLRPARPKTPPLEDPRRLPRPTIRRRAATSG